MGHRSKLELVPGYYVKCTQEYCEFKSFRVVEDTWCPRCKLNSCEAKHTVRWK